MALIKSSSVIPGSPMAIALAQVKDGANKVVPAKNIDMAAACAAYGAGGTKVFGMKMAKAMSKMQNSRIIDDTPDDSMGDYGPPGRHRVIRDGNRLVMGDYGPAGRHRIISDGDRLVMGNYEYAMGADAATAAAPVPWYQTLIDGVSKVGAAAVTKPTNSTLQVSSMPSWLLPAAAVGGAVALVLVLKKKKKRK